ncbi:hypothetical protein [Pelagibacterium lacus]|uniref:Uncharacterized protein n=1 Tax=Pelagibacterium lacus TaxID=2282655 RepID=A0A369W555_9HYPH|nr:hypothetical protein [Pelagibacterium lacus]RDE08382.1 hypothetical protein DVH29_11670 [Pelagibacterium lacus]
MSYDPIKVTQAGDALNRGIPIVNTVWLALGNAELDRDVDRAADTLFEARAKLIEAQRLIGLHNEPEPGE